MNDDNRFYDKIKFLCRTKVTVAAFGFLVVIMSFVQTLVSHVDSSSCLLCYLQRGCLLIVAITLFLEAIDPCLWSERRFMPALRLFFTLLGLGFSSWHLYLLMSDTPTTQCLPSLSIMLSYFSWTDILVSIFSSLPPCNEDTAFTFLGVPLVIYSVAIFIGLLVFWILEWIYQDQLSSDT